MTPTDHRWLGPLTVSRLQAASLTQLPTSGGVYLWTRGLELTPECAVNPDLFHDAITELVTIPFIHSRNLQLQTTNRTGPRTIRPGLARIGGLNIGGGDLSYSKTTHLRRVLKRDDERRELFKVLKSSVARFGPVLYVGESGNLRTRIGSHLTSKTDLFGLATQVGMDSDHLLLYCLPLPGCSTSTRTLIEQILTLVLVAPFTRRTG